MTAASSTAVWVWVLSCRDGITSYAVRHAGTRTSGTPSALPSGHGFRETLMENRLPGTCHSRRTWEPAPASVEPAEGTGCVKTGSCGHGADGLVGTRLHLRLAAKPDSIEKLLGAPSLDGGMEGGLLQPASHGQANVALCCAIRYWPFVPSSPD